jgi:hypothetical protein
MNEQHPIAGVWVGGPPKTGEAPPALAPAPPPGDMIMYQRQADREWVMAVQETFADAEVTAHLDAAIPAHRAELKAKFARLRERDLAYLAAATPAQLAIGWGDAWYWRSQAGLSCWGQVQYMGEMIRQDLDACAKLGLSRADAKRETAARAAAIRENYGRGWRSGRGFSVIEPDGEMGYAHVATLTPCSQAEFKAARARGWR